MEALTNGLADEHGHGIYSATTVEEIQATLAELAKQEASVTAQLDALIASQNDLSRELGRLDLLRAQLGTQVVNTRNISNGMLSGAAATAHRISSAVKRLDREQENVKATLEVVEQVAELKACVLGVHGSMGAPQDWETAAGYLHRASQIPDEVIDGPFAELNVPTTEVPDPPRVTLENAAESLCGLFLREFERATKDADGARVTRYFKLFPLIGRSDVGLDAYGRYVCQGVAARARSNLNATASNGHQRRENYFHANALTKLFEHIAQIIGGHQPLVEQHYGAGKMLKVIERLQMEADVQGGIILDAWSEEKIVDRKLTDVRSYAFSFIVQSFATEPRKLTSRFRSESPFSRDAAPPGRASEDEGVNTKEIDALLGEAAVMLGRWALYARFLASRTPPPGETVLKGHSDHHLTRPDYVVNSNLQKKIQNLLISPFNEMCTFFFRRSVEKAFQLYELPPDLTLNINKPISSNTPYITSAVDDVMYMVSQVLQRALSTSQREIVASVVPGIGHILSNDFVGMCQRKMKDECYPKAAIQGALPPEDKIIQFLVLVNSLDVANEYLQRIISSQIEFAGAKQNGTNGSIEPSENFRTLFPFNNDAVFVLNTLKSMEQTFTTKNTQLMSDGILVAFHQILKPRLRPVLQDAFRDVDYSPANQEGLSDSDEVGTEDVVARRFTTSWNTLTRPLKRIMTKSTWDRLLAVTLPSLAASLERRLWAMNGRVSELGATRLERDVSGLVAAACGEGKYTLRDSFARCSQIVVVAGMEEEEWEEMEKAGREGAGGEAEHEQAFRWVLSGDERLRARGLVGR